MLLLVVTHLQKSLVLPKSSISVIDLKEYLYSSAGIEDDSLYYTYNGKLIGSSDVITDGVIYAVPRLVGGKGGFGSMLRAIGAQIEKTTNREACRDLSGRRLRDINEEKRLKNWIAQQADREREVAEKRKRKLERLCAEPKHEFKDKEYEKQRSDLTEKVWDAVDQGMKASTSGCSGANTSSKRKLPDPKTKTKKTCLWMDDIEDISSSPDSDDSEEESESVKKPLKEEDDKNNKGTVEKTISVKKEEAGKLEDNDHGSSGNADVDSEIESVKKPLKEEDDKNDKGTMEKIISVKKEEAGKLKDNGHSCSGNADVDSESESVKRPLKEEDDKNNKGTMEKTISVKKEEVGKLEDNDHGCSGNADVDSEMNAKEQLEDSNISPECVAQPATG